MTRNLQLAFKVALSTSTLGGIVGSDVVLPSKGRRLGMRVCMCGDTNNRSCHLLNAQSSQVALVVKNPPANAGDERDSGLIPGSMGFSRQEHWRGLPFPPPGDLPDPGFKPTSLVSPALTGRFFPTVPPGSPFYMLCMCRIVCLFCEWAEALL